jgi:hypothetical protein
MPRPHIEFLQSQSIAWQSAPPSLGGPDVEWKILSHDTESDAVSTLMKFPANYVCTSALARAASIELFVLAGSIKCGDHTFDTHFYGYLPAGNLSTVTSSHEGAVALIYFDRDPTYSGAADTTNTTPPADIECIDTTKLHWENSNMDPEINHLHAHRKNLRLSPTGDCRTYLLGGLPQGFPYNGVSLEQHPHAEEFFMVSGDLTFHVGTMRTGAYFWRPPHLLHGKDCTRSGFLLFCRTPGSNKTISMWTTERYPVTWAPTMQPILPPGYPRPDAPDKGDYSIY